MKPTDPRVRRTHEALAKALIALTLEKGYEAITVRDLAERAGIGPATFYRHYPHKEALLSDVLDVFVTELLALLPRPGEGTADHAAEGALIFRYIEANQALSRVLLASDSPGELVRRLQALSASHLPTKRRASGGRVPPEIAAHHLVAASLALIQWWLENDRPYPPERMGEIYAALVVGPTVGG